MQFSVNDIRSAVITAHTTGTVVAAPGAGYRIVVIGWLLSLDSIGEIQWLSAATPITGAIEVAADTPIGMSASFGALACAENEALSLEATQACNGHARYVVVRA